MKTVRRNKKSSRTLKKVGGNLMDGTNINMNTNANDTSSSSSSSSSNTLLTPQTSENNSNFSGMLLLGGGIAAITGALYFGLN